MDIYELKIECEPAFNEILMAELSQSSFDSFEEREDILFAYVREDELDKEFIKAVIEKYSIHILDYKLKKVVRENWNQLWEKNYQPIIVDDRCAVVASFHNLEKSYEQVLVIDPKMSFGTGHHETTYQMISNIFLLDLKDKDVLDAGCGTGVLAILACRLGAKRVLAIDIDDWAVENSLENINQNHCEGIEVRSGTVEILQDHFDVILANINKNVLIEESASYAGLLNKGGHLLISGFYETDKDELIEIFENLGMVFRLHSKRKDWACVLFVKE